MLESATRSTPQNKWLLRIPEVFADEKASILHGLAATSLKKLGKEYSLVDLADVEALRDSPAAKFVRWNLPLHHSWPCNPREAPGFIEKAAQALARKFGDSDIQAIMAGALDPGANNRYDRSLASNLRGRTLQLFPERVSAIRDAEDQDSRLPTLFCLVGKEGLFCGLQSPVECNGFHPGGTKFIRQNAPGAISRAGAKIAEALHHLTLFHDLPAPGSHWLELGASPGGMTAELLHRKYQVTAVDRAPLDKRLNAAEGLNAVLRDAGEFTPDKGISFDAILSDMNGDARESIRHVIRLSNRLRHGGLVIFTLKLPGVANFTEANDLESAVVASAEKSGLQRLASTHLTYNRQEFTLVFEKRPPKSAEK